jgi:hypothetical protein
VGKPVIIEETSPLKCSSAELTTFIVESKKSVSGWVSFYWGKPLKELRQSKELGDAILLEWLETFQKLSPQMTK